MDAWHIHLKEMHSELCRIRVRLNYLHFLTQQFSDPDFVDEHSDEPELCHITEAYRDILGVYEEHYTSYFTQFTKNKELFKEYQKIEDSIQKDEAILSVDSTLAPLNICLVESRNEITESVYSAQRLLQEFNETSR
jgi:hypothetical protein